MTIEEAIDVFDGMDALEGILLFYQRGGKAGGLTLPRIKEASQMSIAALRAQQTPAKLDRKRWKGCGWCDVKQCATCIHGPSSDISLLACSDFGIKYENYKPVNYCENCGRPITEEAWAELERRIGGGDGADEIDV